MFLFISITGTTYGQWTKKADEISKRAESNNILYKNKLYVFGGFGDNPIIEKTNEVYDIATNKWSTIASFPAGKEITHQGVVLVDDNVWLIGGRSVDAHGPASSQVIIYNITSNTWSNGPELINPATGKVFPIGAAGYALLGRTIHVFGGFGPTLCEDQAILHLTIDVDKYLADTKNVTWENKLSPMPIPRNHLSYVVLGGKIYAFGGQFKHDCGAADQVYCHVYDSATDKWTRLTDLPKPRSHAEAATFAVDGKIFLVAGQSYNDLTQNTTYQFTPQANNGLGAWTNLTAYKLPGSFLGLSAKLAGSSFIITNGALNKYANERKETYVASVTRTKTRTFGFAKACVPVDVQTGNTSVISNLLFCIEDTTPYTATADVNWLTIIKKQSGEVTLNGQNIEVLINTVGLSPGKYTGNVTAKNSSTGSNANFCVNLNVTNSQQYTLNVATTGNGTVTKLPDRTSYDANGIVKLTATPATGWKFKGWTGDTIATVNPISRVMNTNRSITATFIQDAQPSTLISDVSAVSGKNYEVAQLNTAVIYYTDRGYKITALPSDLVGAEFIKTPNDDKLNTTTNLLTFTLNQSATVYVAYDPRATTLPAWLSNWKKLTDKIGIDDPKLSSLTLYSKDFSAGKVTIGGNRANPANGSLCGYIVIAKAPVTLKTLATASVNTYKSVSINQPVSDKPVLYPNPVSKTFQVLFPQSYQDISNINIVDINGRAYYVPASSLSKMLNKIEVNIASLSLKPGLYSLLIHLNDGQTDIIKFIIE
ncbi:Kelch repeat-containing protein [Mucilaginibacter limnophilus]|uniref:Kelch repeat-containing protein n=1 Tax=Mucilaginibacter limnophilus TaxID=1932778 RepID=UPI0013E2ED67|nr:kelch repeat-containing protein [Mucilaginibacter limnophilus]